MTTYEFLNSLTEIAPLFQWRVTNHTLMLRGIFNETQYCPITAVCYKLLGKDYSIASWPRAAKELSLTEPDAREIVFSADRIYLPKYCLVRKQLFTAVGMTVSD